MSTRLADLSAVDTAYTEALKHEHLPHMAEQLKMPYTNAPIPNLVFQELRKTKYESCPADIQAGIVNFFGLATTLPCEQANRSAKNAISRDQDHCRIAAERMMLMPYRRGVMHTMNQFNELRHDEYSSAMEHAVETPATKKRIDPKLFEPGSRTPVLPLGSVASKQSAAPLRNYLSIRRRQAVRAHCILEALRALSSMLGVWWLALVLSAFVERHGCQRRQQPVAALFEECGTHGMHYLEVIASV